MMKKDKWVWMPHAGHCIIGDWCRFHLSTYVGKYLVSTIGEYWPERAVREIHASIHDPKWFAENIGLKGDNFDNAYRKKFGFEDIGCDRKYETMVFKAMKSDHRCCPYKMISGEDIDMDSYNDADSAYIGHLNMCKKWSQK